MIEKEIASAERHMLRRCSAMLLRLGVVPWTRAVVLGGHRVLRVQEWVEVEVCVEGDSCCSVAVHNVVFAT